MIDLHAHILPGIDDGARDEAEAMAAARQALAAGVGTVVATPHAIPGVYDNGHERILERAARLQAVLDAAGLVLGVRPGAEYYLEPELPLRLDRGELLTLNDRGKHVLVELPLAGIPAYADRVLFDLLVRGVTPVLAHPERNREFSAEPERLYRLVAQGVLVQVTAGSLTGLFGRQMRAAAELFVRQGWVHFVASDLHGPGARLAAMREVRSQLAEMLGAEEGGRLLEENPRCVLEGRRVAGGTPQPYHQRRRGGIFGRWAGRSRPAGG